MILFLLPYQIPSLLIVTAAFLIGLFVSYGSKLFTALKFCAVGYLSIAVLISPDELLLWAITPVFMAILILMTMKCGRKYALPVSWSVLPLYIAAWFLSSNSDHGFLSLLALIVGLGFLIAATVIRTIRKKKGTFGDESHSIGKKSGILITGDIFSALSYAAFFIGIRTLIEYLLLKPIIESEGDIYYSYYGYMSVAKFNSLIPTMITAFVLTIAFGITAFFMLRYVKKEVDCDSTSTDFALYIWSWVPLVISVVVVIIFTIILFVLGSGTDSSSDQSGNRVVKDEKGNKHRLDYKGGKTETALDENGDAWVTEDGGKTFGKRDTYVIKDENGTKKYARDEHGMAEFGARPSTLKDDKGEIYDVDNWGNAQKRD